MTREELDRQHLETLSAMVKDACEIATIARLDGLERALAIVDAGGTIAEIRAKIAAEVKP